jgi:hypothetical protein
MNGPDKIQKIVFVGAGNVGLPAIQCLALVMLQEEQRRRRAYIVDYDRVAEKDIGKGYYPSLIGEFKSEAAASMVKMMYGPDTALGFHPLIAAAESIPGLFREADVVFNATDSKLGAAYVSEQARNTLEIRMSTGIFGKTAAHSVEVFPKGFTIGDLYDTAAWADTTRQQCKLGTPVNSFAGVAQPFGGVAGSLAVHLMLSRADEKEDRPYVIQIFGEHISQSFRLESAQGQMTYSKEIPFSYNENLLGLFQKAANLIESRPDNILLEFPTPFVIRQCAKSSDHAIYWGFERQPSTGSCHVCGANSHCFSSPREVCLDDVSPISQKSLRELNTPAGLPLTAWSRNGKNTQFHLPFNFDDIPRLMNHKN